MFLIAAFLMGLVGSLHCVGMCGAIALSLPLSAKRWLGILIYNLGRLSTYALLGVFFGSIGVGFRLAGIQKWVSIVAGVLLIVSVLLPISKLNLFSIFKSLPNLMRNYLGKSSLRSLFLIGILNGLLPCGLVYMALAGAITMGNIVESVLYMIAFGLATMPALFAVSLAGSSLKVKFQKIIPTMIVIVGILFIVRGLALGIPYLSPKDSVLHPQKKCSCHKPN